MKLKKQMTLAMAAALLCVSYGMGYAEDQEYYSVSDGTPHAAQTTYEFKPDSLFEVHTKRGYIVDIKLKPGETITYLAAGDTTRWLIDQSTVAGVTHVYIKPLEENIMTNMVINTNSHSYRLLIDEGNGFTPIIQFSFPQEDMQKALLTTPVLSKEEQQFSSIYMTKNKVTGRRVLKKINKNYEIKKHGKFGEDMLPVEIFDDGIRTYYKMPKSNKYDLPTLYLVEDGNKLSLVNYRVRGDYFIADRVFEKARLKYSATRYIDIVPKKVQAVISEDTETNN